MSVISAASPAHENQCFGAVKRKYTRQTETSPASAVSVAAVPRWVQAGHCHRRGQRLEQPTKSCRADTDPFSVRARHPSAPCPPRLWRDCVRELLGRVVQPGNEAADWGASDGKRDNVIHRQGRRGLTDKNAIQREVQSNWDAV